MTSNTNPSTSTSTSTKSNPNLEDILLQTLMGRLQLRPQTNPLMLSQSLGDLLYDDVYRRPDDDGNVDPKSYIFDEEYKVEKEVVRLILGGETDSLMPNSGKSVKICDHHICVSFHNEKDKDSHYRVWEWHGHIMVYDGAHGYSPEYIYGNYFERLLTNAGGEAAEEEEEKVGNLGLRELIDGNDSSGARILHRNMNAGSPR